VSNDGDAGKLKSLVRPKKKYVKKKFDKICQRRECGKSFRTSSLNKRYCSDECRRTAKRPTKENPTLSYSKEGHVDAKYWDDEKQKYVTTGFHRLVWEREHGPIPPGMLVHHKDENKRNNKPWNLELKTRGDHNREHHQVYKNEEEKRLVQNARRREKRHPGQGEANLNKLKTAEAEKKKTAKRRAQELKKIENERKKTKWQR